MGSGLALLTTEKCWESLRVVSCERERVALAMEGQMEVDPSLLPLPLLSHSPVSTTEDRGWELVCSVLCLRLKVSGSISTRILHPGRVWYQNEVLKNPILTVWRYEFQFGQHVR